jgi:hypothetical protein
VLSQDKGVECLHVLCETCFHSHTFIDLFLPDLCFTSVRASAKIVWH